MRIQNSKIEFHFLGIPNIHVMCDSLYKLVEVVSNPSLSMIEFLSGIASSSWLKHIRSVMETSIFIAKKSRQVLARNVQSS
ncbi:myotubularin-related protein 6-like [Corticium candelabrum]|uniref:myotubularin-related protein 6-like n=1 Tax=Corticium candelabrum TaxID=121492 RepID=UPI002E275855|nr:myotubularin-related protein 6-like [Corticium candelabrum]